MLAIAVAIGGISVFAKPQAALAGNPESGGGPYVVQVVEPSAPVNVPDDAVILPYDPDWRNGAKDADRVLVPYDRYVELWNRVHPDKKIETKAPPAPYALAGAAYKTLLEGDEYLLVTGELQIDVFSDAFVQIPLGLSGGVLAQAELDGKPARLSAAPNPNPQAATVLYVSGKGRHKLDLSRASEALASRRLASRPGRVAGGRGQFAFDRRAEAAHRASPGRSARPPQVRYREGRRDDPHGPRPRRRGRASSGGPSSPRGKSTGP